MLPQKCWYDAAVPFPLLLGPTCAPVKRSGVQTFSTGNDGYITEAFLCSYSRNSLSDSFHIMVKQGHRNQHFPRFTSLPKCGLKDKEIDSHFPEIYNEAQLNLKNVKYLITSL
jgi:hypothetical protein